MHILKADNDEYEQRHDTVDIMYLFIQMERNSIFYYWAEIVQRCGDYGFKPKNLTCLIRGVKTMPLKTKLIWKTKYGDGGTNI